MAELVDLFSFDAVGKSPAIFNPEKLLWLNAHYIKDASPDRLLEEMKPLWLAGTNADDAIFTKKIIVDLQPRVKTLTELVNAADFYFTNKVQYEEQAAQKFLLPEILLHLQAIASAIPAVQNFGKEGIEEFLKAFSEERKIKFKVIAQPLRVALTGKTVSPGIDEVMVTLGKERVMQRINDAVHYIESRT